ncbi:MAG: 2-oxoacid:acceptor oxidoreductase family protein [Rhodocyclaceae bacterium]|nr:2-oxoacid:acceptor oxidoreductase family protein [Rhodocyclaceae bacterium]
MVIRFVGDSGDGMQLTGTGFSRAIAKAGHDFATHPDYPSEIRAPTGTLFGVSGYQIQFASRQVFTSGDAPDVLVAMNPAALKTNLSDVKPGGIIIANSGAFTDNNLAKAGYAISPLADGSLGAYRVYQIDISGLTAQALKDSGLSKKDIGRCKNFYALGLMLSLYSRPLEKEGRGHPPEVRQEAGGRRGECAGASRRLCLRRRHRDVHHLLSGARRRNPEGNLPQPDRQPCDRARLRCRFRALRRAAVPRFLPDHARHRHSS